MRTCLVSPSALEGERLEISGDTYRHLFRAARLAAGEELRLVDGEGRARRGRVVAVHRQAAEIALAESLPAGEPSLALTVWSPLPKAARAAWMVEKLTEVGVVGLRFYRCPRAPRQAGPGALDRLRRVASAAVEQCGRSRRPALSGTHDWSEVPTAVSAAPHAWILDSAGAPGGGPPDGLETGIVVVGPEGGLTAEELAALEAAGGRRLALGPTPLRVETAAVVGSGLLLAAARRAGHGEPGVGDPPGRSA